MKVLLTYIFALIPFLVYSQTLESEINPDGIIYPRFDTNQRDMILSPVEGQCIYNTDFDRIECYNGSGWNRTSYYSIPSSAFDTDNDDNNFQWISGTNGAFYISPPTAFRGLVAPINLPHSSKVVNITIYYEDSDPAVSCNFTMVHNDSVNPNFTVNDFFVNSIDTGASPGSISIPTNIEIDNLNNSYHFSMRPNMAATLSSSFKIYKVVIEYMD